MTPPGATIDHPMHIHLINFQVVDRRSIDAGGMDFASGGTTRPITLGAAAASPSRGGRLEGHHHRAGEHAGTMAGRLARQTGKVMYHCHFSTTRTRA